LRGRLKIDLRSSSNNDVRGFLLHCSGFSKNLLLFLRRSAKSPTISICNAKKRLLSRPSVISHSPKPSRENRPRCHSRYILLRLTVVQISDHCVLTDSRPPTVHRRNPIPSLIYPKMGSLIVRRRFRANRFSSCRCFSRCLTSES